MGFLFANKQRDELLTKAQETLETVQDNNMRLVTMLDVAQKNNEFLTSTLTKVIVPKGKEPEEEMISPELAAYALNLCMVSVSQIIEYNDLRIMEQEYDAILNNLNLRNFPKDEALLSAIKQILDSITFFKVQAGEKALLEQEYQQKVKNAIWKAIPGFGIVPGGDVVSSIVSIVAQVGIGYMNYRNAREEINLEQKRKYWELERAAIEQFNGLRRELFETAWRLSGKYQYDEKCRLTERMISQYNEMLLDPEPLRRYERLLYFYNQYFREQKECNAYPPIYYYLGHAANEIFLDNQQDMGKYHEIAKKYLRCYIDCFQNKNELLREDLLLAQACLEYYDLLTLEERQNNTWLITKAQEKSGNARDVQQMCALAYFQAADYSNAAVLLNMLINESYNTEINAQLLSLTYAIQKDKFGMDTCVEMDRLRDRCPGITLMRMPTPSWDLKRCLAEFVQNKRQKLCSEYSDALSRFVSEYQIAFTSLWIQHNNDQDRYISFVLQMGEDLEQLCKYPVSDFVKKIEPHISEIKYHIENELDYTVEKGTDAFTTLVSKVITDAAGRIRSSIAKAPISEMIQIESDLREYKITKGHIGKYTSATPVSEAQERLECAFLGKDYAKLKLLRQTIDDCMSVLTQPKYSATNMYISGSEKRLRIALRGDPEYDRYRLRHAEKLKDWELGDDATSRASIVAIFNSKRLSDLDILFTTNGIAYLKHHELIGTAKYSEIRQGDIGSKKTIMIGDTIEHDARDINIDLFVELCDELCKKVSKNAANTLIRRIEEVFAQM